MTYFLSLKVNQLFPSPFKEAYCKFSSASFLHKPESAKSGQSFRSATCFLHFPQEHELHYLMAATATVTINLHNHFFCISQDQIHWAPPLFGLSSIHTEKTCASYASEIFRLLATCSTALPTYVWIVKVFHDTPMACDCKASSSWFNMASPSPSSWLGSQTRWEFLTGITLHFLLVVPVLTCQRSTAGPDTYPDSFLFSSCQIPIVFSYWMSGDKAFCSWKSQPCSLHLCGSPILQGCIKTQLSLFLWHMWLGLCCLRDLYEEHFILPFAFPDTIQSVHLHMHFLHISQERPMSPPALAAQTSTWGTVTSGLSSQFQARSLDLWCARGDHCSASRPCLAVCHCHHYTDSSSLEQHFWAAWACLSMPTALLLLAHPVPRAPGCWHTLNVSEVRTQMQVCSASWQDLPDKQLFTLAPVAVQWTHKCQLCQGPTTRPCIGVWTIKLQKKGKWSAMRPSTEKH